MVNIKLIFISFKAMITSILAFVIAILTAFFPAKTQLKTKINEVIAMLNNL